MRECVEKRKLGRGIKTDKLLRLIEGDSVWTKEGEEVAVLVNDPFNAHIKTKESKVGDKHGNLMHTYRRLCLCDRLV